MMNKLKVAVKDPWRVPFYILKRLSFLYKDDEKYLRKYFYYNMHKYPNLDNPQTYNEKLTWLKLHDKHPEYSRFVDKYEVKEYVREVIGGEHVIPTIGIWESVEDINWEELPNTFVLKVTHDSGGLLICRDKKTLNIPKQAKRLKKCLIQNFSCLNREYPYLNVKHRIIGESLISDGISNSLNDYKFFCFDGRVKFMFVATDRPFDTRFDFYDREFNHLKVTQGHPNADKPIERPENYDQMVSMAEKLSKPFHHVRVDLYNVNGQIYFGELTFFHFSGNMPFVPERWDYTFGELLTLPDEK